MTKDNKFVRLLAYITGMVNQRLLLQCEYLVAENRILRSRGLDTSLFHFSQQGTYFNGKSFQCYIIHVTVPIHALTSPPVHRNAAKCRFVASDKSMIVLRATALTIRRISDAATALSAAPPSTSSSSRRLSAALHPHRFSAAPFLLERRLRHGSLEFFQRD